MNSQSILRSFLIITGLTILLSCSADNNEDLPLNRMHAYNSHIEKTLIDSYDALFIPGSDPTFLQKYLDQLLTRNVVVDTVIIDFRKFGNVNRLIATSKNNFGEKIILNLECSNDQFMKYQKFKCQSAYIAASINKLQRKDVLADIDTLSSEKSIIQAGKEIHLTGTCLELIETPTIYFYKPNNV